VLAQLSGKPLPLVVLGGVDFSRDDVRQIRNDARSAARRVLIEVATLDDALAAQEAGFEGLVLLGSETGRSSNTSFMLLQQVHGKLHIPYWLQGGIGPQTAAAALLAGAAGVMLAEQLWLAIESPFTADEKAILAGGVAAADSRLPLGQDIELGVELGRKHGTVGRILAQFRVEAEQALQQASAQHALGPDSPLAKSLGVQYPVLEGLTTDAGRTADFCHAVAAHGALPLVPMGRLGPAELDHLFQNTAVRLGGTPWGVRMLGFLPARIQSQQLFAIERFRPKFAVLDGGDAELAQQLERLGVHTFVHVPSAAKLRQWLEAGLRRFVVEGAEAAGHVGPRGSFAAWQLAVQTLQDTPISDPENVELVLAGGIHDGLSAAMAGIVAAPLVARRMKVGVLIGTAYRFTTEAVTTGAITAEAQQRAIGCRHTELLVTTPTRATRVARSPLSEQFRARRQALRDSGRSADDTVRELERFIDEAFEHGESLAALGAAATLRESVEPMAELHRSVCSGSQTLLAAAPEHVPAWGRKRRPKLRTVPLAVVGLGCMFPQSPDVRSYWQNILRRFDAIQEIPAERWHWQDFYDPDRRATDRCYSKWGAFLDEIVFDPFRYRMPPATMASIEPIQLMALEVARQALEDAGVARAGFPMDRTAVLFAAAGSHDMGLWYSFRTGLRHWLPRVSGLDQSTRELILNDLERQLPKWTEDSFAGFLLNVVAGRISNRFDLKGSNFTVDAACASSFAALQTAAEQLWSGACDAALIGAVDGTNNPFTFMCFSKTYALSPGGRSRPFDAGADGIGLGEGIGALVIKRLDDAERDGDKIYAVIRGIGSSSDGAARSLTAPFPDGQALALRRAYEHAGVSPATVTLVEAHGTGTTVGDQVEVQALSQMFAAEGAHARSCAIGSVKSMIGHTKTVAGLASLIKTSLALRHKVLPPTIGVETPNAVLSSDDCPFYISAETRPWFEGRYPRRAGVSAFGFGGTNFHVVLEEYRDATGGHVCPDLEARPIEVFFWSRADRPALIETLRALDAQLAATPAQDLAQLACAAHRDQQQAAKSGAPNCRLAIVAESVDDLRRKIALALKELPTGDRFEHPSGVYYSQAPRLESRQLCFLFPGQGSQSVNMLREVVLGNPWAWDVFEQADRELGEQLAGRLTDRIYPQPAFREDQRHAQQANLNDTRVAQPALGAVELFALRMLERFGVQPGMTAGHSYGEWVALCAAGVIDRQSLVRLSALRGQATYEACSNTPGAMASVMADGPTTQAALAELQIDATPANFNAENQTVIAGSTAAIEQAIARLPSKGLQVRKIPVTAPFHTPAVAAVADVMRRHLAQIDLRPPRVNVYGNSSAAVYSRDPAQIGQQLAEHIARPVLFAKMIQQAYADGARAFVEVGPGAVLTSLVRRNLKDRPHLAASFDGPSGWTAFGQLLARLAVEGLPVAWQPWFEGRGLNACSVEDHLQAVRAKNQRKPTDWIVGPGGARPCMVKPPPAVKPVAATAPQPTIVKPAPAVVASAVVAPEAITPTPSPTTISRPAPAAPVPSPAKTPGGAARGSAPVKIFTGRQSTTENTRMGSQEQAAETSAVAGGFDPAAQSVLGQFQASMTQWLELQKQFLETQQRVMMACLQGGNGQLAAVASAPRLAVAAAPAAALPAPAAASAPVRARAPQAPVLPAMKPAAPAPAAVPMAAPAAAPRPVAPAPEPVVREITPTPVATAPATAPAPIPAPAPAPVAVATEVVAAASSNGAPPVEVFRQDLLEVISDRTGYPVEMLDENVDLETGLGIDSIKTLEILSMLGKYHAYLPGASDDQEATMATFASLRTIGDIVRSYQTNSQKKRAPAALPSEPSGNGSKGGATVQRATLQTAEAGANGNGDAKKKASLTGTSS
jgi:acyl transferase domain-containing protein